MTDRPRIAITLGDPRGVGPEIVGRVIADPPVDAEFLLIGPEQSMAGMPGEHRVIGEGGGRRGAHLSAEEAGRLTGLAVEEAVRLALAGDVEAIVTGPAEKRALHLAGYTYPGHTEWLAHLAGGVDVAMMLTAGALRVVLITTHIPLKDVPTALTRERIVTTGNITRTALSDWWQIAQPRLALCALNPHAGEAGLFGDEEERVLEPAARELEVAGPLPADTVFVRALRGEFDAVLAPVHDVGMTAIKVSGFGSGVNVTLGLPFVRTAPDHGTAFDIAGKGIADPGSMREAVRLAARLGAGART